MIDLDAVTRLRQEMVEVSRQIFTRGLTSATSGNTSARVPGHPEQILIKATGKSFGDVEPEDFILVDLEGNILAGQGKPSKEIRFHLGILKARPEVQAVVHGHSAYATAYVTARGELPVVTAAAEAGLNKIGIVDYAPPGSVELAEMVIKAFADLTLKAAVLKRHGFVTVGENIHRAFYLADVLEDNAKVAFLLSQLG
ncbi:3-oxo-tetronate 4-phosphate decarboxylase [Neomoorella glycerini]|uniref:3-oxo-tetronate 4-phosphate decarboxylase n=1 Tax=Neomoorella glycerini TaxID=55779 RepID=A0A6I5ZPC4_9FIRM|nr:class II aldolase/adducin family protein [Moorella glycerini]QGP91497.1 3-oxo-tetronate 4-phosphate decarboxylase [Moorella glycerini]